MKLHYKLTLKKVVNFCQRWTRSYIFVETDVGQNILIFFIFNVDQHLKVVWKITLTHFFPRIPVLRKLYAKMAYSYRFLSAHNFFILLSITVIVRLSCSSCHSLSVEVLKFVIFFSERLFFGYLTNFCLFVSILLSSNISLFLAFC